MSKKIHFKTDFELCYLRHKYLDKVDIDLNKEDIAPYLHIIQYLSSNTYYLYKFIFDAIGIMLDDILAISKAHLVSFLGLFALEQDRKKMSKFRKIFKTINKRKATQEDILVKNKNSFNSFLRQRMEDLVRICKQKVRNIKGARAENYLIFSHSEKPTQNDQQILTNYRKLGFRKVNHYLFQSIKRKVKNMDKVFEFEGKWYIIININNANVTEADLLGAGLDSRDNAHNLDPETILFNKEDQEDFKDKRYTFSMKSDEEKMKIFKEFVEKNEKNPSFGSEIKSAKRKIQRLEKKLNNNER